jgi:hypothetical protein
LGNNLCDPITCVAVRHEYWVTVFLFVRFVTPPTPIPRISKQRTEPV